MSSHRSRRATTQINEGGADRDVVDEEGPLNMEGPRSHRIFFNAISVSEGISWINFATYLLSAGFSICFLVFLNSSQVFVITNLLGIKDKVGEISGNLVFADELLSIFLVVLWGALSDKIGTRFVNVLGYLIIGVSLMTFVSAQKPYPDLLFLRLFFAVGASNCTAMLTAILAEYNGQSGRNGRISGLVGLCTGVGALVAVFVLLPLPNRLAESFSLYNAATAPTYSSLQQGIRQGFYITGALAIAISLVLFVGLKSATPEQSIVKRLSRRQHFEGEGSADPSTGRKEHSRHKITDKFGYSLLRGFYAARDKNIAMSYLGGFVARADTIVVSVFISLFVNQYFVEQGLCEIHPDDPSDTVKSGCHDAFAISAALAGTSQTVALILAAPVGILCDRFNRNATMLLTAILGTLGFFGFSLIVDPQGQKGLALLFAALIGGAQIGMIVTSLSLCTDRHESREGIGGSIAGAYSFFGGLGILIVSKAGGFLFDAVSPSAPFALMSVLHLIVAIGSCISLIGDYLLANRKANADYQAMIRTRMLMNGKFPTVMKMNRQLYTRILYAAARHQSSR